MSDTTGSDPQGDRPTSGDVRVAGHDVQRERSRALAHLSAVLEGNRNLYWRLTVRENDHPPVGEQRIAL